MFPYSNTALATFSNQHSAPGLHKTSYNSKLFTLLHIFSERRNVLLSLIFIPGEGRREEESGEGGNGEEGRRGGKKKGTKKGGREERTGREELLAILPSPCHPLTHPPQPMSGPYGLGSVPGDAWKCIRGAMRVRDSAHGSGGGMGRCVRGAAWVRESVQGTV